MENKQYILIEIKNGDWFTKYFETEEEGIKGGDFAFSYLTKVDKNHTEGFYLIKSANPDPDAPDHFDGDVIKDWLNIN